MKPGAVKEIKAHAFERQAEEHYVEPEWADRVLFENEPFTGAIFDPCCGFGRIPEAARAAGLAAFGMDIVDRGFPGVALGSFLEVDGKLPNVVPNVVMNPPFNLAREFIERACELTVHGKVAAILQARRLNAAHWMRALPLARIWMLTPRPSMLPGHLIAAGQEAGGGIPEYCWVVFDRNYHWPSPLFGWLHRDRGSI